MPTPVWPTSLQKYVNQSGFSYDIGSTTIESETDIGPGKARRRSTKSVDTMNASIVVSIADYTTLYSFFDLDTNGGATAFYINHPITQSQILVRFSSPPKFIPLGGVNFTASFSLKVLP